MNTETRTDSRKIYQVGEITRLIKAAIENEFGCVWIEGELSNVSRPSSGHIYFTLKDSSAQIRAALFRGSQRGLTVPLEDGLKIRAYGRITVYERSGQYQIIVEKVEEAGKGSLQEAFEKLKKKLEEEGLFAPERKKRIPILPQHVGVVTSPTGAAIRDILDVITRRFPNIHVVLAPTRVQGEGAGEEIAGAIRALNRFGGIDVIIVGRGGGSLEDLWCFNEEVVARAIAASDVPIISAVGHEIDFTISDFAADLRAPTPSAAAELVVGQKEDIENLITQQARRIVRALETRRLELKNRFVSASRSYVFREPANLIRQFRQRIQQLSLRMAHESRTTLQQEQQRLDEFGIRMAHRMELWRGSSSQILRRYASQLQALSPLAVLDRGYSITLLPSGRAARSTDGVKTGDTLTTKLAHGSLISEVQKVIKDPEKKKRPSHERKEN